MFFTPCLTRRLSEAEKSKEATLSHDSMMVFRCITAQRKVGINFLPKSRRRVPSSSIQANSRRPTKTVPEAHQPSLLLRETKSILHRKIVNH